jgi:uncharacterized protein DUF4145
MTEPLKEYLRCNDCRRKTWHALLSSHALGGEVDMGADKPPLKWTDTYDIFQCQGCETPSIRRTYWISLEDADPDISFFPPRISRHVPKWAIHAGIQIFGLLSEVYAALQANSSRLALMGIRALIDVVVLDKVGDVGSFAEKLEALQAAGYVGQKQREFLAAVLDAGSAAAHRGHRPTTRDLNYAMDIVENLLQAVYVLESSAKQSAKKHPREGATSQEGAQRWRKPYILTCLTARPSGRAWPILCGRILAKTSCCWNVSYRRTRPIERAADAVAHRRSARRAPKVMHA